MSLLLALLSIPIAYTQLYLMLSNRQADYVRKRLNMIMLLFVSVHVDNKAVKRLNRRQATPRGFWVRPGRTSAWWDNFVNQIVI